MSPHVLTNGSAPPGLDITITQEVTVDDVIAIAEVAGQAILEVYSGTVADWHVEVKADSSPVTDADTRSNTVICNGLAKLTPHIPIVSEENKQIPYCVRKGYRYYWLIDPLDGTKEFLKRSGDFTVNIALITDSKPVLGVVTVPTTGVVYWAVEGAGAFRRQGGRDTRLEALPYDPLKTGLTVVASGSHMSAQTREFVDELQHPKFSQLGSSLKLLMVAEGAAHVYPRLAPTCEWDTAAAHVVVTEAGGSVIQAGQCDNKGTPLEDWKEALARNEPLLYNKQDQLNPFFVVYGKRN